ncbi:hypothetical protein PYCC9005_005247 [Savitreella phatthalungensis]
MRRESQRHSLTALLGTDLLHDEEPPLQPAEKWAAADASRHMLVILVLPLAFIYRILVNRKPFLLLLKQVFINVIFVLIWIMTFKNARLISPNVRPRIHVRVLELRDEQIFSFTPVGVVCQLAIGVYSFAWSALVLRSVRKAMPFVFVPIALNVLHSGTGSLHGCLDVLAWLSYGVIHFASPFLCAIWLWLFAPPGVVGAYGWSFGIQNCLGIMVHLTYPTAAPWYGDQYGHPLPPGNYSMPGSPAGLVRVDTVLSTHLYENAFKASPLVFGAFPSLHGAFSCCCMFYIGRYSTKGKYLLSVYVLWQWWATMYLRHHWRIDLVGGLLVAAIGFTLQLPSILRKEAEYRCGYSGASAWDRIFAGTTLAGAFGPAVEPNCGDPDELFKFTQESVIEHDLMTDNACK